MEDFTKYKRLIESLENEYFFYSHNLNGQYLYMSPSVEKVLGYTVEQAKLGLVKHMTDSEANKKTIETLKKSATGEKQQTFEFELYTKSREIKVIEITESPLYDDQGNVISVEGVAHDITKRKLNEAIIRKQNQELLRQKEELQETLQNLKDTQSELVQSEKMRALGNLIAGIAHEINTPVGAINASVSNISAALDSFMSNLFDLFTKLTQKEILIFLQITSMLEKTKPALTSKEKRQFKKDVQQKLENAGCTPVHSLADLIMYLNLYEKTDQVISMLDVEDPEFILKSIKDIYSVRKNTENIKLAIDKASKMVFALKKFAHREQNEEKDRADLVENIETVLILHHNQLKQAIEVVKDYEAVPMIACYPDELIQVWTNLVSNAIHAMNYAGTLKISIKNQHTHINVSIQDSGHGIPEDLKDKIFQPFFTTKKSGEGTGIGLDIVKRILDKHQAKLELESKTGVGTTFHVLLPVN